MLDLKQLKKDLDKDYTANQTTRERASDDLVFYWVTQWDDTNLGTSDLRYRGEFNMLRKAGNQIMSELRANPVHPDFEPIDETRDDSAEVMDGLWRKSSHHNASIEAFNNAQSEAVVCGFGAWKLINEYETNSNGDNKQVIRREPVYEANNNLFIDANAKRADKSDANRMTLLVPYTIDGYKQLVKELTGEEIEDVNPQDFASPEQSYSFPWIDGKELVYIAETYYRTKVEREYYIVMDIFGYTMTVDGEKWDEQEAAAKRAGFRIVGEKYVERYQIDRYIASGKEVLDHSIVPGQHIPIIPMYGYRAFIEGEEHWEGCTRIAKDPQRLRNFQLSYLGDIVSRSPRKKPIFFPEQIRGYEFMYEESGANEAFPYALQNSKDSQGRDLPLGPVNETPNPEIPQALAAAIQLTREAIDDVANPGLPQDLADPDLSGKAVVALQNRMDMQTEQYQTSYKHAIRRDAEVFASMAAEVYDTPRMIKVEGPDGEVDTIQLMEMIVDPETMEPMVINDLSNANFEVYAEIGPAYSTQKQQTKDELIQLMSSLPQDSEAFTILLMKYLQLTDGEYNDDIREYAKTKLLMMGLREPQTEQEMQMVMQQQLAAQQQVDPNMELAKAEQMKAIADNKKADVDAFEAQVKAFEAETKRQKVNVDAAIAGIDIRKKQAETTGTQIDNAMKLRGRVA